MLGLPEQFIVDAAGRRVGVILDIDTYRQLLAEREELQDLWAFYEAMEGASETVAFEQAVAEIEAQRNSS